MTVNRDTIKSWFKKGLKPFESQFANWIDSFWHKDDNIPIDSVEGLSDVVNNKYDKATGEALSADFETHKTEILAQIELLQDELSNMNVDGFEEITEEEIDEIIN
jgi:hypothetical protein